MSEMDFHKKIHVIVHGNQQLFEKAKSILIEKKFPKDKIQLASLDKAGEIGDYVAMAWPPMAAKEFIISQISGTNGNNNGMGAWAKIEQKELLRVSI
ncbi:MAG: hypothetical protein ACPKPY_01895 [Nitrososphaeraceae archaeon]